MLFFTCQQAYCQLSNPKPIQCNYQIKILNYQQSLLNKTHYLALFFLTQPSSKYFIYALPLDSCVSKLFVFLNRQYFLLAQELKEFVFIPLSSLRMDIIFYHSKLGISHLILWENHFIFSSKFNHFLISQILIEYLSILYFWIKIFGSQHF